MHTMSFPCVAIAAALLWTSVRTDSLRVGQEEDDDSEMLVHSTRVRNSSIPCATVRMYRHCVRSTTTKVKGVSPEHDDLSHYTDLPLPAWNTPMKWCTDQGSALMKSEGKKLRQRELKMDLSKLKVIVDTDQRDATSANSLLQGLADQGEIFAARVEYFPVLFNAFKPGAGATVCKTPSKELMTAQKQQRLHTTPMPMGVGPAHDMNQTKYNDVLELFEKLFGVGAAGSLKQMSNPPIIDNETGLLKGAPVVLKLLATNLMFAYASNITIATHVPASRDQIFELTAWTHWERRISQTPALLVSKKACGVLSMITMLLGKPRQKYAIFVGHDSDLDALAHFFQITWKAPPFPAWKPTPPGSSLSFTSLGDGTALVHFTYQVFDSSNDPEVKVVPTLPGRVSLFKIKAFIETQIMEFAGTPVLPLLQLISSHDDLPEGSGAMSPVMRDADFSAASCPVSDLRGLRGSLSPPQHTSPRGQSPDNSGEPLMKQVSFRMSEDEDDDEAQPSRPRRNSRSLSPSIYRKQQGGPARLAPPKSESDALLSSGSERDRARVSKSLHNKPTASTLSSGSNVPLPEGAFASDRVEFRISGPDSNKQVLDCRSSNLEACRASIPGTRICRCDLPLEGF
ncbi:ANKRD17 [Symbiodinium sp. CCMP2592]|nr:ANKRD17 [Symbiodinium sp. CCMP2592]